MRRKPSMKDRVVGCLALLKELVISALNADVSRIQLNWMMFKETAKGNFEVWE